MRNNRKINRPASRKRKGLGFFRFVFAVALLAAVYFGLRYSLGFMRTAFPVKEVVFLGNKHLSESELKAMTGLKGDEGLLWLSGRDISKKLLRSPWVRTVSLRKDFPRRLIVKVEEAAPFALLEMNGKTFFVDDRGNLLEEIRSDSIPFMPVLLGDPFRNHNNFLEAINLVRAMKNKRFINTKDRIEVIIPQSSNPEDISMQVDGTLIKIGYGEYEDKLERLLDLQDEIIRRGIPVDYIDLRFANRVVVKPVNEVVR